VAKILASPATSGSNSCAVAAALLGDVVPDAREEAITVLCEAIRPRTRSMVGLLTGAPTGMHESTFVVETMARVLVSIGGTRGRDAVEKRASKSSGALKERLEATLKNS
jgi:hypothetical protein